VETLRSIGRRHNATPGEVAIAWTLRNPAVTGAIVGVRSAQQVSGIAGAADVELSPSDIFEIEQGLTRKSRLNRWGRSAITRRWCRFRPALYLSGSTDAIW
jgi:aryl-alcohol dehydrogenase-like predicted oxidoreductase